MNIEKWFKRFKAGKIEGKKTIIRAVELRGEPCNKVCSFGNICKLCDSCCEDLIREHFGIDEGDRYYLKIETKEMKFISYDGEYPNLCSGTLKFEYKGEILEASLYSTGCAYIDEDGEEIVEEDSWGISSCSLTSKEEIEMLTNLANTHVPKGCCGGCI